MSEYNAFGVVHKAASPYAETKSQKTSNRAVSGIYGGIAGGYVGMNVHQYYKKTGATPYSPFKPTNPTTGERRTRWSNKPQEAANRRAQGYQEKPDNPNFNQDRWDKVTALRDRAGGEGEKAAANHAREKMMAGGTGPMKNGGEPGFKEGSKFAEKIAPHLAPHNVRAAIIGASAAATGGAVYGTIRHFTRKGSEKQNKMVADKKAKAANVQKNAFGISVEFSVEV